MNDVKMNESLVFDACALVEEICRMDNVELMRDRAEEAAALLNKAMEEGEKIE